MRYPFLILLLSIFAACNNNAEQKQAVSKATVELQAAALDTIKPTAKIDTVLEDIPADTLLPGKLLTTGIFHEDEVSLKDAHLKWIGLFKNRAGDYYITPTVVHIKKVIDKVVDEGNQKTGRLVSTNKNDSCVILFSGYNLLQKPVKRITLNETEIVPGAEFSFENEGITYTIYATGKPANEAANLYFHTNYRLYCKTTIKGKVYNQLLVAHAQSVFGSSILFAGDVDGDNIPDLLINTTKQEGAEAPTLYLSKPAYKGNLFKAVAMHAIVGC